MAFSCPPRDEIKNGGQIAVDCVSGSAGLASSQAFRTRSRSCFIASVVYETSSPTGGFSRDEVSQKYEGNPSRFVIRRGSSDTIAEPPKVSRHAASYLLNFLGERPPRCLFFEKSPKSRAQQQ